MKHGLLIFALGVAVFTASPPEGATGFLRIPFVGSYMITYFDVLVGFCFLVCLSSGEFRFHKDEKRIYQALGFVILARILSLAFASNMAPEQVISILRYIETFVILVLLANMLALPHNRRLFLSGVIVGALAETAGGLTVFFASGGENRGIWLGLNNYELQVFVLVFLCLLLRYKRHLTWAVLGAIFLFLGITVTETRRAIVVFSIALFILALTHRRAMLKPILAVLITAALVIIPVIHILPDVQQSLSERVEQLWTGGGTIGVRFILWEMAAEAYLSHPVTGIGSGGFARQQNALYLEINDAYAPEYEDLYGSLSTHDTVLGAAAETGTLGLLAYFLWVVAVVRSCLRGIRLERVYQDPAVLAACVCILGMMFEDWWGQASFIPPCTCLLGLLLGWLRSRKKGSRIASALPDRTQFTLTA